MFSLDVVDTDKFLDMPCSTQALYFQLGMRADDDGFVASPKKITQMVGCASDDLKILISKGFVIPFDSGVCFISDWRVNNYIRPDRYKPTIREQEKQMYFATCHTDGIPGDIPMVYPGKDRLGKDKLKSVASLPKEETARTRRKKEFKPPTLAEVRAYCLERDSAVDPNRFFEYFETGNWRDSKGQPVKNWKQKLLTWERAEAPDKAQAAAAGTVCVDSEVARHY